MSIYLSIYYVHVLLTMYLCPYTHVVLIDHWPFPYTYGSMNKYLTISYGLIMNIYIYLTILLYIWFPLCPYTFMADRNSDCRHIS